MPLLKLDDLEYDRAANYHADSEGTEINFNVMSEAISQLRVSRNISADWKKEIDKDYENRAKSKPRR